MIFSISGYLYRQLATIETNKKADTLLYLLFKISAWMLYFISKTT